DCACSRNVHGREPIRSLADASNRGCPAQEVPMPLRVSTVRTGLIASYPDVNQPATSTSTCAGDDVKMQTSPVPSTLANTEFGSTAPAATKFTFDALGIGDPHGHTVRYPQPAGSTAVTFSATAVAFVGTPATPVTF